MASNPYEYGWPDPHTPAQPVSLPRRSLFARFALPIACILFALLVLMLVGGYLGFCAIVYGKAEVYVVNGTETVYAVEVDGRNIALGPYVNQQLKVAYGELPVRVIDGPDAGDEFTIELFDPLWLRPFRRSVFVINPDRTAVLEWEQCGYYSDQNMQNTEDPNYEFTYNLGEQHYRFDDIDYVFEPFPEEVWMSDTASVALRTRVSVVDYLMHEDIVPIAMENATAEDRTAFCIASLKYFPEQYCYYDDLRNAVGAPQMLEHIEPMLQQRPFVLAAHISCQEARLETESVDAIRREYQSQLESWPDDPVLMYLVGRLLENRDESEALLEQAAAHEAMESMWPRFELFQSALATGRFERALQQAQHYAEEVGESPLDETPTLYLLQANLSLDHHAEALQQCRELLKISPHHGYARQLELLLLDELGREDEVQPTIERFMQRIATEGAPPRDQRIWRAMLESAVHYHRGEYDRAADSFSRGGIPYFQFWAAMLRGQYPQAESALHRDDGPMFSDWMALAVAAEHAGDVVLSGRCAIEAAALLPTDVDGFEDIDAALRSEPYDIEALLESPFEPYDKKLLLTWIGQRHEPHRRRCFALARALNFEKVYPAHLVTVITSQSP